MNRLQKLTVLAACLIPLAITTPGCASMSGHTPPSTWEQSLFDTFTNHVAEVTVDAATGSLTTNKVEVYTFTPKEGVATDIGAGGAVVDVFAPGVGGLVSGGLLSLLALWGKLRSYKTKANAADETSGVLAQNIEAIREFIRTVVPKGQDYDDAVVQFLMKEQDKANAVKSVTDILGRYVTSHKTKSDLLELKNAFNSLTKTQT